jgi:hypothetical protein
MRELGVRYRDENEQEPTLISRNGGTFPFPANDAGTDTYKITTINDAITKVSKERGKMGAIRNRLEHTIANLDTSAAGTLRRIISRNFYTGRGKLPRRGDDIQYVTQEYRHRRQAAKGLAAGGGARPGRRAREDKEVDL